MHVCAGGQAVTMCSMAMKSRSMPCPHDISGVCLLFFCHNNFLINNPREMTRKLCFREVYTCVCATVVKFYKPHTPGPTPSFRSLLIRRKCKRAFEAKARNRKEYMYRAFPKARRRGDLPRCQAHAPHYPSA